MKIDINVPDGTSGNWSVETFKVEKEEFSQMISYIQKGRGVPNGTYKKLMNYNTCVMSNTPDEIRDFTHFLHKAEGSILINGLGIGVLVKALLDKPSVTKITIIEKSKDVIKLVSDTYSSDERICIINEDAFDYKPPKGVKYNAVWHDIWNDITCDNLPEMIKLHRKYGRRCDYQESWCRCRCEEQKKEEDNFFRR